MCIFTNFHEICLLLCCFWQVGSATKKKGAKMIEHEGRCSIWWRLTICVTGGLTLRRGRFPFLFLNLLKTVDLFWSGKFWTGTMSWILHSKECTKKQNPPKKKRSVNAFPYHLLIVTGFRKFPRHILVLNSCFHQLNGMMWRFIVVHSFNFEIHEQYFCQIKEMM